MKIDVNACTLENFWHIFSSVSGKLPPGNFPPIKFPPGEFLPAKFLPGIFLPIFLIFPLEFSNFFVFFINVTVIINIT